VRTRAVSRPPPDWPAQGSAGSLSSAVNRPRQASRLPPQVEPDVEVEQVGKDGARDPTDGALRDVGKDCVAQLGEEAGADAGEAVCVRAEQPSAVSHAVVSAGE